MNVLTRWYLALAIAATVLSVLLIRQLVPPMPSHSTVDDVLLLGRWILLLLVLVSLPRALGPASPFRTASTPRERRIAGIAIGILLAYCAVFFLALFGLSHGWG